MRPTSSGSSDTPSLRLLRKQRSEIHEIFRSPLLPSQASKTASMEKENLRKETDPEHLVVLVHGLDGTPNDLGYVKRKIEGTSTSFFCEASPENSDDATKQQTKIISFETLRFTRKACVIVYDMLIF
jgi:hypothetical protein